MADERFATWLLRFQQTGDICPVRLGLPREELRSILGDPDDFGGTSRKHPLPRVWKYGHLEFHFGDSSAHGLCLIYQDAPDGIVRVCIGFPSPNRVGKAG